ncbi:unnamed protein product [Rotaria sp. Silwood1]|nr:unnamed protein product [Rotaria sp. Silwood1]CAF3441276.1 unnamed protein product [Rotaria sp. Silwood1]CAF4569570.1 unnamed protein product [Rotaria sp. Silwood1]
MPQVVATQTYCLENSNKLTRPGFETFLTTDDSRGPTVVDKRQVKRLYRLQRKPNTNTRLHLDNSDVGYDTEGHFESVVRKQIDESFVQPPKRVYHRPLDVSNKALAKLSLGKTRRDPQQIIPSQITTVRSHPEAITILRHEQDSDKEIVPRFTDRLVLDRTIRSRLGPGGTLNPGEDCKQAEDYLRNLTSNSKQQKSLKMNELHRNQLAHHFMCTSMQQAAFDEIPWDSKLPPKLPVPLTTYEVNGSDPLLKSKSHSSFLDSRTCNILQWDRVQSRNIHYNQKPFNNVEPLPRAQQIPGYSGSIGGYNLQDIDNPEIDFKPYTVLRTEQPKFSLNPFKTNIPFYTGKTHWTKVDPVSHYDEFGHAYTTTAAFHKSFPIDNSLYHHSDLHGPLSQIVTTVIPQNPFNQMDISSTTINASIDSRSHILIRQLPRKSLNDNKKNEKQIVNNEVNN